jgi:hypothetical protein
MFSARSFARFFDKIVPAVLLLVGSAVAAGFANIAGI